MDAFIVTVVISALVATIIYGLFSISNDVYGYFYNSIAYKIKSRRPLPQKYRLILKKYCAYYNKLPVNLKPQFEKRLQRFIVGKKFIARDFQVVTDEMKVLISATAIQITFGLPEVYLSNFDKILIYHDSYYSQITKQYHNGEVNPKAGVIVLSWNAFVFGYGNTEDSRNVGIHEMAHAIHLENRIKNKEYDFLDYDQLVQLKAITDRELPRIKSGAPHFFRPYAATDEYEFFAVALEYFFENPKGFKEALPDLYRTLVLLLRQDPLKLYNLGFYKGKR